VDDLEEVQRRAVQSGAEIVYGPVKEPWGVRRFFLRDPFGNIVNVLRHA
jgi:predicted enzyme related to lactoylglutathione lyase